MSTVQKIQYLIKILLDKLFATILLIMLSPLLIVVSILIKIESPGPIIFKQKRLGKDGKVFTIYKFRTMCDNAVSKGSGIFISENDERITSIGKILRKTSIDELPQLINILKSEMSFVGPRPPLENHPYYYENYPEVQKKRFNVLPGITGYAQAYGRNQLTWPERIIMDVYYYENYSLLFDLKIALATIIAITTFKGVYSNKRSRENAK